MAEYTVIFGVWNRMIDNFSREEIENAARVFFYQNPPNELRIFTAPQDLELEWSHNFLELGGAEMIRVVGDVEEPPLEEPGWRATAVPEEDHDNWWPSGGDPSLWI